MLWCLTDRKVDMMPTKLIRETTREEQECQKWPLPRAPTQSHYLKPLPRINGFIYEADLIITLWVRTKQKEDLLGFYEQQDEENLMENNYIYSINTPKYHQKTNLTLLNFLQ